MSRNTGSSEVRLERKLSPLGTWALALGCIIGWGSFIMPGTTFLPQAGIAGTAIAMGISGAMMVVIALNYSFMIRRYPKAGGEFAYVDGFFGRPWAFACSWLLGLCYLSLVAQNATALAVVARSVFGGVFQSGYLYTVVGYDVYFGELALALGALVLFALLNIRGVHFAGVFQTVLVGALVGGVFVVVAAAFASPSVSVASLDPAFNPQVPAVPGVLAVLAIAPFAFVGFDTIPQAAEEYQFHPARAKRLVVAAIVFGALLYVALNTLAALVVPEGYASWPSYIDEAGKLPGILSIPTFYAAHELLGVPGLFIIGAAACGAILSGIVGFYLATSRLLFAMGRDGVLPRAFAAVHPRYHTPRNAILFVFAVAAIAPFFGRTVLGWLVDMSSLGAAVAYGFTSLATVRAARREHNARYRALGALGLMFSIAFCVLLLVPLPDVSASLGPESYLCLVAWVLLGVVFYGSTARRFVQDGVHD